MKTLVLFRILARGFRGLAALKVTATVCFHPPVRVKEVAVNKRNPEPSFYNFPSGKSVESKALRKKWVNVIACKYFLPATGHRVYSLHFQDDVKPTWTSCHIWMLHSTCLLLVKQPGTQHVKPPLVLLVLVDESDCCRYFQGCQTSEDQCKSSERTRVFIGLNSL